MASEGVTESLQECHGSQALMSNHSRQRMAWTPEHDVLLCREVLLEEPYKYKHGSRDRGQTWERIAQSLNDVDTLNFCVDQRAVRDRFIKIERAFQRNLAKKGRAEMNLNPTELDLLIEDAIEKSKAAQDELARGEETIALNGETEAETHRSVEKRPVEWLVEARKRENMEVARKRQKKNEDEQNLLMYLKEKNEIDLTLRMEEHEIRKRELDFKEREIDQQWELRRRDLELKEKEYESREKREQQTLELLQQHMRLQQQQNQLLLDFVLKLMENNA